MPCATEMQAGGRSWRRAGKFRADMQLETLISRGSAAGTHGVAWPRPLKLIELYKKFVRPDMSICRFHDFSQTSELLKVK